MDHVSSPEFAIIFDRVSNMVDLQGATTALEIENRMRVASYLFKKKAQSLKMIRELRRQLQRELGRRARGLDRQILFLKARINRELAVQTMYHVEQLNKLIEHDFAGRAIYEANRNPRGLIAQTLIHGREMADYRLMIAQAQAMSRGTRAEARHRRKRWIRMAGG